MDGQLMPNSYTYTELEAMGVFEFDDIEVKQTIKSNWTNIHSYYFPEKVASSEIAVDEYGQVYRQSTSVPVQNHYRIDEYGQVIRTGYDSPSSSSSSSSSTRTSTSSSSSSNSSTYNSSSNDNTVWKVLGTIVVIIICIAIAVGTNGYGTPLAFGGYYAIRGIWNKD